MRADVQLEDAQARTSMHQAFCTRFAANLNAALNRNPSIPWEYGRTTKVASLFGVSTTTASQWLNGHSLPGLHRLAEIAQLLGTSIAQLMGGDTLRKHVEIEVHGTDYLLPDACWYTLPASLARMGLPSTLRMLRVDSEDMSPFLSLGDLAVYDTSVKQIAVTGVYVLHIYNQFIVRRIQRGRVRNDIRLICDNPVLADELCEDSDFTPTEAQSGIVVVGKVVARLVLRGGSNYTTQDVGSLGE